MQTYFWGDWLAAGVMLGGGLLWRRLSTRHVLVLVVKGEKTDAWFARTEAERDRALAEVEDALG